jgi:hypothetical protein
VRAERRTASPQAAKPRAPPSTQPSRGLPRLFTAAMRVAALPAGLAARSGPLAARRCAPRSLPLAAPRVSRPEPRPARRRTCVAAAGEEPDVAVFRFTLARASPARRSAFACTPPDASVYLTRTAPRQGIPGFDDAQLPRVRVVASPLCWRLLALAALNASARRGAGHRRRRRAAARREPRARRRRKRRPGAQLWRGGSAASERLTTRACADAH